MAAKDVLVDRAIGFGTVAEAQTAAQVDPPVAQKLSVLARHRHPLVRGQDRGDGDILVRADHPEIGLLVGRPKDIGTAESGGEESALALHRGIRVFEIGRIEDGYAEDFHPGVAIADHLFLLVVLDLERLELPQRCPGGVVPA